MGLQPIGGGDSTNPIYGDGKDGSFTISNNIDMGGMIRATDFVVQNGVTVNVDTPFLVIHATNSIRIDGKIDASGMGAPGGSGGVLNRDHGCTRTNGGDGRDGVVSPRGTGGAGGSVRGLHCDGANGGNGGDGDLSSYYVSEQMEYRPLNTIETMIRKSGFVGVGAGGGGGGGTVQYNAYEMYDGTNGEFPGGGGGGIGESDADNWVSSSDGGDGGGLIALMSPTIETTGTLDASGEDGDDGNVSELSGTGGGGGGSGGVILLAGKQITNQSSNNVSGGLGGSNVTIQGRYPDMQSSGVGAPGADGFVVTSSLD